jgi:N-acetylmuramoyl-L-alanine amidase
VKQSRSLLAWLGFAGFVISFLWWQSLPERPWERSEAREQMVDTRAAFGRVVIDPGHGGQDSGKIQDGVMEKDVALDVARRVERILNAKGVATLLTRTDDSYVSLASRAALANEVREAVFVSIHFDDAKPSATGIATYYAARQTGDRPLLASWLPFLRSSSSEPTTNVRSQSLAAFVQEAAVARTHAANRGTRPAQFYVVANVRHPAVLIEGGFLSNKQDRDNILAEEYREQLASAIAEGIMRYREQLRAVAAQPPQA